MTGLDSNRPLLKKIQKKLKNPLKKIVIFSHIFLSILHNIGLYIYTVNTNLVLRYPVFSEILKKNSKHFQKKNLKKLLNQFPFSKTKIAFMQTAKF